MTDLIARLRDADTTRRIGESYADTHERRQRDRDEAADRIEQLEAALRKIASNNQQRSNCFCGACIQARAARAALEGRRRDD